MDKAHTEWARLDRCVDAVTTAALGTKQMVVPITFTHCLLVSALRPTRSDSDNTRPYFHLPQLVLVNLAPSCTTVFFLNLTAIMDFLELKSKIWPPLQIL